MYNPYQGKEDWSIYLLVSNANRLSIATGPYGQPPDFGSYPGAPPGLGGELCLSRFVPFNRVTCTIYS